MTAPAPAGGDDRSAGAKGGPSSRPEPRPGRLLASLPAVYREADLGPGHGDLQTLLSAFEGVLLGATGSAGPHGHEQRIAALPSLLSQDPLPGGFDAATRDAFVPWLAARWVAFTPFAHFEPERLRRIVSGIVPLYARRGTPAYLTSLLQLCFEDEIGDLELREHLSGGLILGESQIGIGTRLGSARSFSFRLQVRLRAPAEGWTAPALAAVTKRLHAVIDFAKPAHTTCDLVVLAPLAGGGPGPPTSGHPTSMSD